MQHMRKTKDNAGSSQEIKIKYIYRKAAMQCRTYSLDIEK